MPNKTKKAIEAKIAELIYSVENHNAKIARETADKNVLYSQSLIIQLLY